MIWLTYNACLIRRESIKVGQSVCNRHRNRPRPQIEEYVRRREKLQGNAGGFATPRRLRFSLSSFIYFFFFFFFFARDVCNLPGRDRGRCRNFSQRAEGENEFSFLAGRTGRAIFRNSSPKIIR